MIQETTRRILLAVAIGVSAAIAFSVNVSGTPEISQKERQGCLVCHTAMGKADLNDRGRYYRAERTLEGYRPPAPQPPPEEREDRETPPDR